MQSYAQWLPVTIVFSDMCLFVPLNPHPHKAQLSCKLTSAKDAFSNSLSLLLPWDDRLKLIQDRSKVEKYAALQVPQQEIVMMKWVTLSHS